MVVAIVWIIVFIAALVVLVKGSDWLVAGSERVGLAFGLSPFVVGAVIVGIGTSFPELVSSAMAALQGATEIVVANAVGSNIANILLIVGFSAVLGGRLTVKKDLIDLDLPMLAIATSLFIGVAYDGVITWIESLILLIGYAVHLTYTLYYYEEDDTDVASFPDRLKRRLRTRSLRARDTLASATKGKSKMQARDFFLIGVGIVALGIGAKYLIDAVIALSAIFAIGTGSIALIAVALGTSMPELLVSARAALKKKSEIALGNIFGSNVFNILVVVGLPGLLQRLTIDESTLFIGLPAMVLATFLFVISGISRRIHMWEGAMYLVGYALFVGKIFKLF